MTNFRLDAQSGSFETTSIQKEGNVNTTSLRGKLDNIDKTLGAIVLVLGISVITLLFMVAGLLIEAWRFNGLEYRYYREQLEVNEVLLAANKKLLETNEENEFLIQAPQPPVLNQ